MEVPLPITDQSRIVGEVWFGDRGMGCPGDTLMIMMMVAVMLNLSTGRLLMDRQPPPFVTRGWS